MRLLCSSGASIKTYEVDAIEFDMASNTLAIHCYDRWRWFKLDGVSFSPTLANKMTDFMDSLNMRGYAKVGAMPHSDFDQAVKNPVSLNCFPTA